MNTPSAGINRGPQGAEAPADGASKELAARQLPMPSDQLLRGRRIVEIAHNGEVYRLQSTRLGKLILTK
ncbi:hemin uptake protein HemP [Caenimonas sedimenti]|uniref:Hemin uptake protein HemP n=1 Tax=Caenimonas sedimenti TaxID=2596921 RepID=A0A562ZWB9_9BURK|nr:hemin uptake protein HemP [Caenimonas sedimenti]TWO72661.1 hemin uptake protein HemP [Caenimonas sedimenti]